MTTPLHRADTGALPPDAVVSSWHDLCLFLGGSPTSFTGQLLELIQKADILNRRRLASVYPREVLAFGCWVGASEPLTAGELHDLIELIRA